ncbi:helix-turn-helix domain-containing protein [Spirosoma sp. RP8]|uniref:Helix-turn-helix domain-containing protein n=1 Tax=Spirosoma liriopis TaxID=2937440 RepID=A0ABT0HLW5_9BACT|nr:helix-turn-helix domain-containing protein [Spirosoma liriopis]MCK8493153.1 helix-turn-helix domain-containing protein [Spirosoma liriopis]
MEVSNNIRSIRERKGLTQVDVANRMGTERSNYARLENRDVNLTLKQVQEIADALEVSIYEIIGMPQVEDLKGEQTETSQRLEERLKMTEDVLKEKRKNIKYYKSFIEWTRDKFIMQFALSVLHTAKKLEIREIDLEEEDELDLALIAKFKFTDEELRQVGDYLFSYDATDYFLNEFIASSGFITEKWYIDAYKRMKRRDKEQFNFSEVKNWVGSVFEFLEEE